MPVSLIWEGTTLLVRCDGQLSADDLGAMVRDICSHPLYDELRFQIFDFSASTLPSADHALLEALAPVIGGIRSNPRIRVACIMNGQSIDEYTSLTEPITRNLRALEYFQDEASARDWISAQTGSG